ncbi:MAG: M28 family peptidase [Promethearchaeota archaeon]|nr:MAG: M28 family peptidase [Candidatus Lokiarchaeota archaeon]
MINEKRISENLKEFSFPRLSGSEFEKRSFNIARKKIEELKLNPTIQDFSFSTFYSRIYPKFSLILFTWLLIVFFLNIDVVFNIVNLVLFFMLTTFLIFITRNPEKIKFGKIYNSQNLFLSISSQSMNRKSQNNIFFLSHLDSKGQAFSIKIRIYLYFTWIISFPIGLVINILISFFLVVNILHLKIIALLIVIINSLATIMILINTTNNKSNGAIDNASGISCVLELLNYFSIPKNRLNNYNLWFVFTGAEESGTMGVRNFYRFIKYFDRNKNYIINFDSIAKKVNLWDHGLLNKKYFKSFNYILENKDIITLEKKTYRFYIGTYSDGLFLLNKKFRGLGNGDRSTYNYVHSKKDDPDKIEISVLKKLCNFYTMLLKELDNN